MCFFLYFCICKCIHFCFCVFMLTAGNSAAASLTNGGWQKMESAFVYFIFCIFVFVNEVISVFVYFCRPQVILQQQVWQTVVGGQWSQWPAYIVLPPLSREIIHWNNKASKVNKNYKQQQQQWSQWWEIINCRKNSMK